MIFRSPLLYYEFSRRRTLSSEKTEVGLRSPKIMLEWQVLMTMGLLQIFLGVNI